MMIVKPTKVTDSNELSMQFRKNVLEFSSLARKAGCRLIPFSGPDLPYFQFLNNELKANVISSLILQIEICQRTLIQKNSLKDTGALLWYALKKFNFRFPSNLFDHLDETDLVEIYDTENVQIFRNFNFLSFVSYSIEDLFCRPWTELFQRMDPKMTVKTIEVATKIFNGEITKLSSLKDFGEQYVKEVDSPFKFEYLMEIKAVAPVYEVGRGDKKVRGLVVFERAKFTSPPLNYRKQEGLLMDYYLEKGYYG